MAKILIYKDVVPNGEYDIFNKIDYIKYRRENIKCYNVGNRAWLQGIIVALQDGNNELVLLTPSMTIDYINSEFDYIVLPMANIFHRRYIHDMERLAKIFFQIKVPTFVIACGVQAKSYDYLEELINSIKEPATLFIKSIYSTGGEFALRGYFTKEFFDKLGFRSAVVTGCPSLYQLGDQLRIEKQLNPSNIKSVYNGKLDLIGDKLLCDSNSVYIDQDEYYEIIYAINSAKQESKRDFIKNIIKKYGYTIVQLAMEKRALLFLDIPTWRKYLMKNHFNFSYGTRIHGTIISILSGVPSLINICDSRTREMAEFYAIPMCTVKGDRKTVEELYDLMDYKEFNECFFERYHQFEKFLVDNGLVKKIGSNNVFFNSEIDSNYVKWMFGLLEPYRSDFETNRNKYFAYYKRQDKITKIKQNLKEMLKRN